MRLLLIEDETELRIQLRARLQEAGYAVDAGADGLEGWYLGNETPFDLAIVDLGLPKLSGIEIIHRWRAKGIAFPVLVLTARGRWQDKVEGLDAGADDYLVKPFHFEELLARIKALLRRVEFDRAALPANRTFNFGDIHVDLDTRKVTRNGKGLALRYKEFELLSLLLSRAGQVVSRAEIFDEVWGTDWLGDTRTLDVHIRWLREKIEPDPGNPQFIQTVRGVGYRFVDL